MARIDQLAFYNAYAVWRENMGEQGVNLQDERYGFRCQITQAMREFARRAMRAGVSKNFRQREIDRKRALVKKFTFCNSENLFFFFLENTNTLSESEDIPISIMSGQFDVRLENHMTVGFRLTGKLRKISFDSFLRCRSSQSNSLFKILTVIVGQGM